MFTIKKIKNKNNNILLYITLSVLCVDIYTTYENIQQIGIKCVFNYGFNLPTKE